MIRVAIAGNPNSGKTSLFNALTQSRAKTGNYTGVTVERREAAMRGGLKQKTVLVDLPGCYSLTARSAEEDVAQRVLLGDLGEAPCNGVVCAIDATQLGRGLYLLLQLRELGLPCKVLLTMMDLAAERGSIPSVDRLSNLLGVEVLTCNPRSQEGMDRVAQALAGPWAPPPPYLGLLHGLSGAEAASLDPVAQALGQYAPHLKVGEPKSLALWLVVSALPTLTLALPEPLLQAAAAAQKQLDPHRSGAFGRRIIGDRFRAVDAIVRMVQTCAPAPDARTRGIDEVVLHPVWGTLTLVATLFAVFQAVFAWAKPMMDGVGAVVAFLGAQIESAVPQSLTQSLLVHGVLAGVGNVLTFVPQIALLFLLLGFLEESGYMARAALLLDRIMRQVGLSGRAFVPLMSSFACAVPGIMAARTLDTRRDRLVTMLIAPFMGCSARLPVYTLVVAATFAQMPPVLGIFSVGGLVIFAMYVLGFVAALGTAWLLGHTALPGPQQTLLMELPAYRTPQLPVLGRHVLERCRAFVAGTGATIVTLSVLLWALLTFPQAPLPDAAALAAYGQAQHQVQVTQEADGEHLARAARAYRLEHSVAGHVGRAIEPLIAPLGFDWRIGVGLMASFAAREVLVSTLAQVYALDADSPDLLAALTHDVDPVTHARRFTQLTGLSLMVFFVLAMQCMSTVAVLRKETGGWGWPLVAIGYMNALAYGASLLVYQGGTLLGFA